jgi:hypothetical protein
MTSFFKEYSRGTFYTILFSIIRTKIRVRGNLNLDSWVIHTFSKPSDLVSQRRVPKCRTRDTDEFWYAHINMGIGDYQFGHLQPLDIISGSKNRAKGDGTYHFKTSLSLIDFCF